MNRSRVTADLASHGNIFVDIANDRVGIGSTIPTHKVDVSGTVKLHDHTGYQNHIIYNPSGPAAHLHFPTGPLANLAKTPYLAFGDRTSGGDFKIYHDYYNTHLKLVGLGGLHIGNTSGVVNINGANGSGGTRAGVVLLAGNEGVKLYHGSTAVNKFETVAYGVTVHGTTETQELNVTGVSTFSGDVILTDTTADSAAGPEFKLFRNSASPADADYLGQIKFAGESDTGVERNYAKITGKILDASNGTEDGILEFAHIKAGSQTITGRWRSDSLQLLNSTNFSVAGTSDFTGTATFSGRVTIATHTHFNFGSNNDNYITQGSSGNTYFRTAATTFLQINNSGHLLPYTDSTFDLGTSSKRFRNLYADTLYGDGSNLTGITQTTINSNADNRVITGSGTANTLNAESTLTFSDRLTINTTPNQKIILSGATHPYIHFYENSTAKAYMQWHADGYVRIRNDEDGSTIILKDDIQFSPDSQNNNYKMWHAGNDGSGSGLDADTLDGVQGSSFLRSDATDTASGNITINGLKVGSWSGAAAFKGIFHESQATNEFVIISADTHTYISATTGHSVYIRGSANSGTNEMIVSTSGTTIGGNTVLTTASGLNASNISSGTIPAARLSASDLLTKIKTVDGSGSGLDADSLDGIGSGGFLRSNVSATASGQITLTTSQQYPLVINSSDNGKIVLQGSSSPYIRFREGTTDKAFIQWHSGGYIRLQNDEDDSILKIQDDIVFSMDDGSNYHKIWHAGNDGSGSGLDADLWDGNQFASYLNQALLTSSTVNFDRVNVTGSYGILNSGWFRSNESGEGMYNQATTQYFYSDDDDFWNVAGGGAANGIRFRDDHAGTIRGYVYANNANQVGFLNQNSDWALRTESAGITKLGSNGYKLINGNNARNLYFYSGDTGSTTDIGISGFNGAGTWRFQLYGTGSAYGFLDANWGGWDFKKLVNGKLYIRIDSSSTDHEVWCAGNDGSGSGLDADTLDGNQASAFATLGGSNSFSNSYNEFGNATGSVSNNGSWNGRLNLAGSQHARLDVQSVSDGIITALYSHTGHTTGKIGTMSNHGLTLLCNSSSRAELSTGGTLTTHQQGTLWGSSNDGPGSGLDADTLDGTQGSAMIRSGAQGSVGGWHISAYRNGSGTSPHMYFSHNAGYGMHINTYNTNAGVYAFELNSNSKVLFQVFNDGRTIHGGHTHPGTNNAYDLGTTTYRWRNVYTQDLQLSNEAKKDEGGNDVDGSWGDWTLQEGEDDVFMINNRSGKKFRIKMEEVS